MRAPDKVTVGLLVALLLILPLWEGGADPLGIFVTHSLVFALGGWAVGLRIRQGSIRLAAGWEAVAGLGMIVVSILSFLRVDYFYGSFLSVWNLLMVGLLAGAMMLAGDAAWRTLAHAVVISSAVQAVTAFAMTPGENLTPSGTFANASQLAAYLNIGILVTLALAASSLQAARKEGWRHSRWGLAGYGAAAILDLAALVRTGARGAMISLLLAGVLWLALLAPGLSRRARYASWCAILAFALVAVAAVTARFERIEDPYRFDRTRIWAAGLRAAGEAPILGMGPGMFERRGYKYNFPLDREVFRYSKRLNSAHSTYLQALAETGVLGLLAMALFVALLLRRLWSWRDGHSSAGPAAMGPGLAVLACLIHGFVDRPFAVPAVTWTLVTLAAPLLTARSARDAPLYAATTPRRTFRHGMTVLSATAVAVSAYFGAVLLPHRAHAQLMAGLEASEPGLPDERITRAVTIDRYNPLHVATRAELTWPPNKRLDPGVLASAHHDLLRAHSLDPGNPRFLMLLGRLHAQACFDIGAGPVELARAEGFYRQAIALGDRDARFHLELAGFLFARGRPEPALEEVREALALEPRFLGAQLTLVRALLESVRDEEAAAAFDRLEETRTELADYEPKNGYEEDLLRLDEAVLSEVAARVKGLDRPL